jgi:hypothetical protein
MKSISLGLILVATESVVCLPLVRMESGGPAKKSGRESAEGWVDLLPGKNLKGWRRVPIAPDTKLAAKNPWRVDEAGRMLRCDGVGVKEMLLNETEFKDGTFHVEWRFRKVADKHDYNSGIYVRTAMDGKVWHQAQVAHLEKRPLLGDLFGETLKDGKPHKLLIEGRGEKLARPPGEWNTYDITCAGPRVTVAVNGQAATTWTDCAVLRGHVGLQAEFFFIEFRSLKFKPMD